MIDKVSFDTNILIYSIDLRDKAKHEIARRIVSRCSQANGVVALQCLTEFYRATTRKQLLPLTQASEIVEQTRQAMRVFSASEADLLRAIQYHHQHQIQFFDALLCSTIERSGCTVLFSEDFQHNRSFGGLTVLNPFLLSTEELDRLTLFA